MTRHSKKLTLGVSKSLTASDAFERKLMTFWILALGSIAFACPNTLQLLARAERKNKARDYRILHLTFATLRSGTTLLRRPAGHALLVSC